MLPGEPPYRRGIHASGYAGRPWTIRQLAGQGTPQQTNQRIRYLLDKGATGVNLLFDVPTIASYDSDEPEAAGMVGIVGAAVDTVDDMSAIFEGIPLDEVSVSVVSHYPTNTAILMGMFLVAAERQGVSWDKLKGSCQNDAIMECVVASIMDRIPPAACFELQYQNIAFLTKHVPRWHPATFNGYNLREFGADIVLESAVALLNAHETVQKVPEALERVSFFWCIGNDFFREIARLRAVREIWFRLTGSKLRCHCQTSGISLTKAEPMNNIVRASYQAMAAVLGGCQSLHVDSYDEAYSVPSEQSSLVSLRTQQILQTETGIMNEPDPLGGSQYVEEMTDLMKDLIGYAMEGIQLQGGLVSVVESGWLRDKCLKGQREESPRITADTAPCYFPDKTGPILKPVNRMNNASIALGPSTMLGCIAAAREGATVGQLRRAILNKYGR